MNVETVQQTNLSDIEQVQIDLAVCASGYEGRATVIARKTKSVAIDKRIALGFMDRRVLSREKNDEIFKRLGYELIGADGDSDELIREILSEHFRATRRRHVNILIDYSSMTRIWYGGVIDFLKTLETNVDRVDVYFAYTPAVFAKAQPAGPNAYMGPIRGFCGLALPAKSTALVIGLGYERHRALGLIEYVEPAETVLFYTDPALDPRFVDEVRRNNAELLEKPGVNNIIPYPLADLRATASMLASVCLNLSEDYRVILAPLGPKPFTLLCLLLASRYRHFDVWRVSAGAKGIPYNRAPVKHVLVCRTTFRGQNRQEDRA